MKLGLYQQVDILFSILEELLSSPFNKQFDDKAKYVLSKYSLEVADGKIVKSQRRVSAEAKENEYSDPKNEEIVKLADEYYNKVLIKECNMEEKEAHHCRISYIHGAKAMLEKAKWRPSEEQMIALDEASGIVGMFTQRGLYLTTLYNDLKKLNQ